MTDRTTTADPFERDLAEHGTFLRKLGAALIRDADLAEDAAQETLVRSLRRARENASSIGADGATDEGSPDGGVRAWLSTVFRNVTSNLQRGERRRRHREARVAGADHELSTDQRVQHRETLRAVVDAVLALPEPYQSAILQRYWEGLPPREIAQKAGVPIATAKSWLARGRSKVQKQLGDREWYASLLIVTGAPAPGAILPIAQGFLMSAKVKIAATAILLAVAAVIWHQSPPEEMSATKTSASGGAPAAAPISPPGRPQGEEPSDPTTRSDATAEAKANKSSAPADRVRIRGRFIDEGGNPLQRVSVSITSARSRSTQVAAIESLTPPGAVSNETDADGRFTIEDLTPGPKELTARLKGFVPILRSPLSLPRGEDRELRDIVLRPSARIRGRVVDEEQRPIDRAEIITIDRVTTETLGGVLFRRRAWTATDGTFALNEVAPGRVDVAVLADGFVPRLIEGVVSDVGHTPTEWTLQRGWSVRGRMEGVPTDVGSVVIRATPASDSPLSHDYVRFGLFEARNPKLRPDHTFQVDGLAPGHAFYISAMSESSARGGGAISEVRSPIERVVETDADVILTYLATPRLTLSARDRISGTAVLDFTVEMHTGASSTVASSSKDGTLALSTLTADEDTQLIMSSVGYHDHDLGLVRMLSSGTGALPPVDLDPSPTLVVQVQDGASRAPLEGAKVELVQLPTSDSDPERSRTHRSDARGIAVFTLPDGERLLKIERDGYVDKEEAVSFPTDQNATWNTALDREAIVVVYAEDAAGQHPQGVQVIATATPLGSSEPTEIAHTTDVEGRAVFDGLAAGEYTFRWRRKQEMGRRSMMGGQIATVMISGPPIQGESSVPIDLRPGEHHELTLHVPRQIHLSGTVREGGLPVEGALIRLVPGKLSAELIAIFGATGGPEASSGQDGSYRIPDTYEGQHTLCVSHPLRALPTVIPIDLPAENTIYNIDLDTCGARGVITMEGGEPVQNALVSISPTSEDGTVPARPRILTMDENGVMFMDMGSGDAAQARTNERGEYTFRGLSPRQALRIRVRSPFGVQESRQLFLSPGEMRAESFSLKPAGALKVLTITPGGEPRPNCSIKLVNRTDATDIREGFVDAMGRFDFDGVPAGSFEVMVQAFDLPGGAEDPAPQAVEIEVGARGICEVIVP